MILPTRSFDLSLFSSKFSRDGNSVLLRDAPPPHQFRSRPSQAFFSFAPRIAPSCGRRRRSSLLSFSTRSFSPVIASCRAVLSGPPVFLYFLSLAFFALICGCSTCTFRFFLDQRRLKPHQMALSRGRKLLFFQLDSSDVPCLSPFSLVHLSTMASPCLLTFISPLRDLEKGLPPPRSSLVSSSEISFL